MAVEASKRYRKHPTRGLLLIHEIHEPVGRDEPISEWGYITPRYPDGITSSDLHQASKDIQRETAAFWFLLNVKPWDGRGASYLGVGGVNSAAVNTQPADGPSFLGVNAYLALPRVTAADAIDGEFEGTISDEVRHEIAEAFPGNWTWIDDKEEGRRPEAIRAELLGALEEFRTILRGVDPAHGEIGHNQPPGGVPFTPVEHAVATATVDQVITDVAGGDRQGAGLALLNWTEKAGLWEKFRTWMLGQLNTFITEANKSVARSIPHWIGGCVLLHQITHLLEALAKAHGGP